MRKLLTGMLLVIGLPAFASVSDDLANNVSASQAFDNALQACGGGCEEQILIDLSKAGVSAEDLAKLALNTKGMSVSAVATALLKAGVNTALVANSITFATLETNADQGTVQSDLAQAVLDFNTQSPATGGQTGGQQATRTVTSPVQSNGQNNSGTTVIVPESEPNQAGSPT